MVNAAVGQQTGKVPLAAASCSIPAAATTAVTAIGFSGGCSRSYNSPHACASNVRLATHILTHACHTVQTGAAMHIVAARSLDLRQYYFGSLDVSAGYC